MPFNIFQNPSKAVPMKADDQIVRVDLDELQIEGRKSHLPSQMKSDKLSISHVPNAGSGMGVK
jgi:hypothetical protein